MQWDISNSAAGHFDVANVPVMLSGHQITIDFEDLILVKEWLKDDDFISRLDEAHKGTQHAFVGTRSNGDFSIGVNFLAKEGRVGVRNSLLKTRAALASCE